jgi:HEAT repeat protein
VSRPVTGQPTRRSVAIAGHQGDEPAARAGLASDDPGVRAAALGALERLRAATAEDVVGALADSDSVVRRRAATIAAGHPGIDLLTALADPDPSVVEVAAWACGERERADDEVMLRLCKLATAATADPLVREASVAALGAIGDDRGLDAILAATSDKAPIRRRAVLALAQFLDGSRAGEVDAALRRALDDRDWQVRQAAEDVLPAAGDAADAADA